MSSPIAYYKQLKMTDRQRANAVKRTVDETLKEKPKLNDQDYAFLKDYFLAHFGSMEDPSSGDVKIFSAVARKLINSQHQEFVDKHKTTLSRVSEILRSSKIRA